MFTKHQISILQVLASNQGQPITLTELGRLIGKAPGVFQRGLNALEAQGFITSHRKANLRLLSLNTEHPLHEAVRAIAHGLSPFSPERAALKAGRLMITELDDHLAHQRNVALETTLSGKRYARLIPSWQAQGYAVKLIFLSLPSVELALARVASRVRQGGHAIPEQTVRRRFEQGWRNFSSIYTPLVDAWAHYDNAGPHPVLIKEEER